VRLPRSGLIALFWAALAMSVACGGHEKGAAGSTQAITVNWTTEPPSLDPGLASDVLSASILLNIMDPLVRLGDDLEPEPSLAERWDVSENGKTVTFHLRRDGRWTNGQPVTANDFEYAWKRTSSPELAADYAYQFDGIAGALEYNSCQRQCDRLADGVGVNALDRTLEVRLTSPQPWFVQQVSHVSFLAVHRPTVERYGDKWTEARNIVTNGPFLLDAWEHNQRIDLVKNTDWRDAGKVSVERVNGRMIADALTAVQSFEAGEIDVNFARPPPSETDRLAQTPEYQRYPLLFTEFYGFNVESVADVRQRRAMSLAIDRRSIVENVTKAGEIPATGFTPNGMPGFETLNPRSPWLPPDGHLTAAKELMSQVEHPTRKVVLVFHNAPGNREKAVAIQAMWKELGVDVDLRQLEPAQFVELLGPPPDPSIGVFGLGWAGDYVDAINFLELWTCDSGNNTTNYCNNDYDRLVAKARRTPDNDERYAIYAELEQILFGEDGDVPITPLYWGAWVTLEVAPIRETFTLNPLFQVNLMKVRVAG
jgi:oligopeptide transport system substrate-binding protein